MWVDSIYCGLCEVSVSFSTICVVPGRSEEMSQCAIVLGGEFPQSYRVRERFWATDYCIAADRGADYAVRSGKTPDLLVGDMDSLDPEVFRLCETGGSLVMKVPCAKDETDGELAFLAAQERGYRDILLFCSGGGRLDHLLSNIFVCCHFFQKGMQITLVEDDYTAYFSNKRLVLHGRNGDILSLIPMTKEVHGVTLDGCRYPLTKAALSQGSSWSMCNEFAQPTVTIQQEDGVLLAVHYSGIDGRTLYERTYG